VAAVEAVQFGVMTEGGQFEMPTPAVVPLQGTAAPAAPVVQVITPFEHDCPADNTRPTQDPELPCVHDCCTMSEEPQP
jgi:hypothetical protein